MMELILILLLALVPTILIELSVLVLLREKSKKVLGASVVVNILTNLPLNLYVYFVYDSWLVIILGEMLVVLVEALWYYLFLHNWSKAFVYSILCNAISFLIGLLVELLYFYFLCSY